ncbi:hypothetical protein BGI32_02905 [Snodgrassella alvi]|uniref:Uncharacterized protein n=1 Tax=Snodgrassella alvi TaxID=1196083 RepID=A0A2N9WVK2_9NEIS|nr:hypothetical protein [Snodgrassella alvi]PIT17342.1 hypothetical protein BGI32_02905 [Snodgrassella alvi]
MLFDTPAKGVVNIAVTLAAACLLNAYFTQAVFGVVVVAAFDEDIRQDGILIALYLFVLQPAVIIIFLK